MTEHEASRTLVKSAPELWAECSDAASLARHLDQFGEIRITKLEPETAVAWEGERVSGTVRLEPSGWGTRVTFTAAESPHSAVTATAAAAIPDPPPDPDPDPDPDPVPGPDPDPAPMPPPAAFATPDPAPMPQPTATVAPDDLVLDQPARGGFFMRLRRAMGAGSKPAPAEPSTSVVEPSASVVEVSASVVESQKATVPAVESVVESVERTPVAGPPPAPEPPVETATEPSVIDPPDEPWPATSEPAAAPIDASAALSSALDSLGQAHHRPFSRA